MHPKSPPAHGKTQSYPGIVLSGLKDCTFLFPHNSMDLGGGHIRKGPCFSVKIGGVCLQGLLLLLFWLPLPGSCHCPRVICFWWLELDNLQHWRLTEVLLFFLKVCGLILYLTVVTCSKSNLHSTSHKCMYHHGQRIGCNLLTSLRWKKAFFAAVALWASGINKEPEAANWFENLVADSLNRGGWDTNSSKCFLLPCNITSIVPGFSFSQLPFSQALG